MRGQNAWLVLAYATLALWQPVWAQNATCQPSCGSNGICRPVGGGVNQCLCACGFSGADCSQYTADPSCPSAPAPAQAAAQPITATQPTQTPAPAPQAACPVPCSANGNCKNYGGIWRCACKCGFGGPDCGTAVQGLICPGAPGASPSPAAPSTPSRSPPPLDLNSAPAASGLNLNAGGPSPPALDLNSVPTSPSLNLNAPAPPAAGPAAGAAAGVSAVQSALASKFQPKPSPDLAPQAGIAVCRHGADPGCGTCQAGWRGALCDACTTNQVCQATLHDSHAVCNTTFSYTPKTVYKSYVCDYTQNTLLNSILAPKNGFWIDCNTTQLYNNKLNKGGACRVGLRVAGYEDNPVQCTASACHFEANSPNISCSDTRCACPKGSCPSIAAQLLPMIEGKSVTASCNQAAGTCTLAIPGFALLPPQGVAIACTAGDCVAPSNPDLLADGNEAAAPPQHRDYTSVIAAIPIMALLFLSLVAGFHLGAVTLALRARRHKTVAGACAKRSDRAPSHPVHCLRFEEVTCSVPASRFSMRQWAASEEETVPNHGVSAKERLVRDRTLAHMTPAPMPCRAVKGPCRRVCVKAMLLKAACLRKPAPVQVLRSACGEARMGELVGVLGPSGCGKTTLLSILAGSVASLSAASRVRGAITLDGQPRKRWMSRMVAYVPQFDFLLPTLTVRETLRYSAQLRLPPSTTHAQVEARVDGALEDLGLVRVAGSQVGGSSGIRGVSGGERRRITIGMELVIDPSILILDEPTSGLDSFTALNLMTTLKAVAGTGRIVLLSFHQPSPAMFELLDRAFLMASGRVVFTGPPSAAEEYFQRAGVPCPPRTTIAEHMLNAVSYPDNLRRLFAHVDSFGPSAGPQGEAGSEMGYDASKLEEGIPTPDTDSQEGNSEGALAPRAPHRKPQRRGVVRELAILYRRTFTEIWRNPALLMMHCVMSILIGILVGGIFYHVQNDFAGAQNRLGAIFFSMCFMALTSLTTVDLLANERALVIKETIAGYYRPLSYYLSKAILDGLLLRVLPALLFCVPFYPMIGFQADAPHIAVFFCGLAVFSATVGALSMAITVGLGTAGRASLIMVLIILLMLPFTGFLVNVGAMPAVLRWLHYLSVFFYGFQALVVNEVSGLVFNLQLPSTGGGATTSAGAVPAGLGVQLPGDTILAVLTIDVSQFVRNIAVLDALYFGFVLLGIALLYWRLPRPLVVRKPRGAKRYPPHSSSQVSLGQED